jgi:hypothetical protein
LNDLVRIAIFPLNRKRHAKIKGNNEMENKKIKQAIEDNFETDNEEIARLVKEGNTSGILDNEAGYRIVWELKIEKFEH